AALVWHHRRNSVRAYWKQQQGYGKAEALLERKWPDKYNGAGHVTWAGRLYGKGLTRTLGYRRERIYHGVWGTGLFQSLYQPAAPTLWSLPLMPEWHLATVVLAVLSAFGMLWRPLLLALPLLVLALGTSLVQAGLSAAHASFPSAPRSRVARLKLRSLTALLHVLQPLARLRGRLCYGLTPWRWLSALRPDRGLALPLPRTVTLWSERWQGPEDRLQAIEAALQARGARVLRGGAYDRWELEVRGGLLGAARTRMAIEEHGAGKQLIRFRTWPRCPTTGFVLPLLLATVATEEAFEHVWAASAVLGMVAALLALRVLLECAAALAAVLRAVQESAATTTAGSLGVAQPPVQAKIAMARNRTITPGRRGDGIMDHAHY